MSVTFHTVIVTGKGTTAGIVAPEKTVAALGAGKKPAVTVTLNGFTYRSTVASMGGKFMIGVSNAVRAQSGLKGGDEVEVVLELDTEPRVVDVPADFAAALAAEPAAQAFFDTLSYSNKRRHVEPIADAKTPETRARRIEKSVAGFKDGKV